MIAPLFTTGDHIEVEIGAGLVLEDAHAIHILESLELISGAQRFVEEMTGISFEDRLGALTTARATGLASVVRTTMPSDGTEKRPVSHFCGLAVDTLHKKDDTFGEDLVETLDDVDRAWKFRVTSFLAHRADAAFSETSGS